MRKKKRKKSLAGKLRGNKATGKQKKKKSYFFGFGSKWLFRLAAFCIILYLTLGIIVGSELLQRDLKEKYGKVLGAVNVSVLVRGAPQKPVVAATTGFDGSYPYIDLDWDDDLGVDTFDVSRDKQFLVGGLAESSYRDKNVSPQTKYVYYVVANGPLGTEQSDEVTIETGIYVPPTPPPPASLTITRIDYIDLTNFRCFAKTNKRKPTFWGTTNISEARLAVEIRTGSGKRQVISSFTANSNGYWSWKSKGKLKKGAKTVYLTAYDPDDATRFATASLRFNVTKKKPSKKFIKKCRITGLLPARFGSTTPLRLSPQMSLSIDGSQKTIHQGEEINFSLSNPDQERTGDIPLQIGIIDSRGDLVYEKNNFSGSRVTIDEKLPAGDYKLFARYISGERDVSAEDNFEVKEKPLLVLSSGMEITSRQILSHLGWATLFLLGLLGVFLLFLSFEYHLTKKAVFQITGSDLKNKGMID